METTEKFVKTVNGIVSKYTWNFNSKIHFHKTRPGNEFYSIPYITVTNKLVRLNYMHDKNYHVKYFNLTRDNK